MEKMITTESISLSRLAVNGSNPRQIKDEQFTKLVRSILVFPKMLWMRPVIVDETYTVLGGNMRLRALTAIKDMSSAEINIELGKCSGYAQKTEAERELLRSFWREWLKHPTVPYLNASDFTEEEKKEFIIKDNIGYGEWDTDILANEWDTDLLADWGLDVFNEGGGSQSDGEGGGVPKDGGSENPSLFDRFVIPPFSILDARQGYWQKRKHQWKELHGDHGESRNDIGLCSPELVYKDLYTRTQKHRKELGISFKEYLEKYVPEDVLEHERAKVTGAGVSLLDPVLAEIIVRWFGIEKGNAFDCFAGDTVFGFVSTYLGQNFTGIELRQEQVNANNNRVKGMSAHYICDDGQNVAKHIEAQSQDLLFSCPPYFDLEVYSDLPNDASNQGTYEDFIQILRNAFTAAVGCLKQDRFAAIVVGDVRNKKTGFYYDFCGDIKRIFLDAGMPLYNELILCDNPASTAIRVGRYMESRKVGKTHQNVLVFYKGDTKNIKSVFPKIEYSEEDLAMMSADNTEGETSETGSTPPPSEDSEENRLMIELDKFREPLHSKKFLHYQPYPALKQALQKGEIHIERDPDTNEIIGYLWLKNLVEKPVSQICEIVSSRKGLGRKLIERAVAERKHKTLELKVVDFNENAIGFYKHMGFVEVERETGKKINNITMRYND